MFYPSGSSWAREYSHFTGLQICINCINGMAHARTASLFIFVFQSKNKLWKACNHQPWIGRARPGSGAVKQFSGFESVPRFEWPGRLSCLIGSLLLGPCMPANLHIVQLIGIISKQMKIDLRIYLSIWLASLLLFVFFLVSEPQITSL